MLIDTTILDALPDAFLLVEDGKITWASAGAARLLDAPADALPGRPFADVLAPGESDRLGTLEEQRRAGWELPRPCRVRFVRPSDGAPVDADVWIDAVPRPTETDPALLYCARNATATSRAEELMGRLAELGRDPRAMLGAEAMLDAAEPVFHALGWTGAFTEIVEAGSITRRIISPEGHPLGEYGRTLIDRLTPFDKTPILAEVVRTGRTMFLPNVPTLLPGTPSGAVPLGESMARARLTRSAWCPVVHDGQVTHLLSVASKDLSEHDLVTIKLFTAQIGAAIRMAELHTALLQRERLAAIGEMAAVIAHEVRNPLSVILTALSRLKRPGLEAGESETLLAVAWEEAEQLKRLVADLLEFARPKAPSVGVVELGPLVDEVVSAVLHDPSLPHTRTAALVVDVPDATAVAADRDRLRRALVNLLVNAFQHVPKEGTVRLSAQPVGSEVRVTVGHDGESIAPDVAKRVFDPFFTTRATGTGLGLALVRRIVGEVGGRVELDPAEGGVSFSVWLPVSDPHNAPES